MPPREPRIATGNLSQTSWGISRGKMPPFPLGDETCPGLCGEVDPEEDVGEEVLPREFSHDGNNEN